MSNRATAKPIRLMGHYHQPSIAACARAVRKEDGRNTGDKSHDSGRIHTTMAAPALEALFLPPTLKEDSAYTIAIDRKSVPVSSVSVHDNLIGLALGYIGLSGLISEKSVKCAALCNEYGGTLYGKAVDVAAKTPDVMMALHEKARTHYHKGRALIQNGTRQAERGLKRNWNEVCGSASRNADNVRRRIDRQYKAFGHYMQEQRQYLDEVVFSRRNMAGLASAGALSVLSVALYKHGLPFDENTTGKDVSGRYPQNIVLQKYPAAPDSESDRDNEAQGVSYKIIETTPVDETVSVKNVIDDAQDGQDVLAYYDRQARVTHESAENVRKQQERREIHDLVTAIPLADSFRVSSGYGLRHHPVTGQHNRMHQGIDIAAPPNTPVEAPADGVVKFAGWKSGYGKVVILDHENGVNTLYAHLNHFSVRRGDRVGKGEIFAKVGATGRVTGPHLHFEIHKNGRHVNPRQYVRSQRSELQSRLQP